MKKTILIIVISFLFSGVCFSFNAVYAKNEANNQTGENYNSLYQGRHRDNFGKNIYKLEKNRQLNHSNFNTDKAQHKPFQDDNSDNSTQRPDLMRKRRIHRFKQIKKFRANTPEHLDKIGPNRNDSMRKRMQYFRENDPQKFAEIMQNRKNLMRRRMHDLKKTDPEKFERLKVRIREQRFEHLKELKQSDPERFNNYMDKKRSCLAQKLEQIKKTDPKKYKRIQTRLNEIKEYHDLRKLDPAKAARYLESNPELKKFIEMDKFGPMHHD